MNDQSVQFINAKGRTDRRGEEGDFCIKFPRPMQLRVFVDTGNHLPAAGPGCVYEQEYTEIFHTANYTKRTNLLQRYVQNINFTAQFT